MIRAILVLIALFVSTVIAAQQPQMPAPASSSSQPKKMDVLDNDEQAIRVVCEAARTAPSLNLENVAGVTQYCLALLSRVKAAK